MPKLIESPEIILPLEATADGLNMHPDTVALDGVTCALIRMANCVDGSNNVCVDALVCADQGCQR